MRTPTSPALNGSRQRDAHDPAPCTLTASCPVGDCGERLGEGGLTEEHLLLHASRDELDDLIPALFRLVRAATRVLLLDAASYESIRSSLADDVISALSQSRTEMTLREVAVAVAERPDVCRAVFVRLIHRGVVRRPRKGRYRLAGAIS